MSRIADAASMWGRGGADYERISRSIADSIDHCVRQLDPQPGERVLDLATGTGWTSRQMAKRGATVVGVDFAEGVLDIARALAARDNLAIDYYLGNAEALPFASGEFDAVASTSGIIFASQPEQAARELARITRHGGRIALTAWPADGEMYRLDRLIHRYVPKGSGVTGAHFQWGDPKRAEQLLGDSFNLAFEHSISYHREPSSEAAWETFAHGHGPTKALLAWLDPPRAASLKRDFIAFYDRFRTDDGVAMPREYLLISGVLR